MTAAVMRTFEYAKPGFGRLAIAKPSHATLRRIETALTLMLAAQMIGLMIRYAL